MESKIEYFPEVNAAEAWVRSQDYKESLFIHFEDIDPRGATRIYDRDQFEGNPLSDEGLKKVKDALNGIVAGKLDDSEISTFEEKKQGDDSRHVAMFETKESGRFGGLSLEIIVKDVSLT